METIPGTSIEIVEAPRTGRVRHAVFDFDGTLSMVRDGWQDVMVPLMVEVLCACPRAESRQDIEATVIEFVDHLTGKQTIYQMIRLAEEVARRGGTPRAPLEYKREYNERLQPIAQRRAAGLETGSTHPEELMVPGARRFLELLAARGAKLYLASGTDVEFVVAEARLLGLDGFFDGGIHGALPNYEDFSKEKVIRKILSDFSLQGPELLVVGDGYIEILNARAVDAIAVGLVSVEGNRFHMNADKRGRLEKAGAHVLVEPDFREADALADYLFSS